MTVAELIEVLNYSDPNKEVKLRFEGMELEIDDTEENSHRVLLCPEANHC